VYEAGVKDGETFGAKYTVSGVVTNDGIDLLKEDKIQ
jgi:hypothetical protein